MRSLVLCLIGLPLFGGQSIQLTGNTAGTTALKPFSHSQPWRVEFYVHDWATSGNTLHIAESNAIGFRALIYNPDPGNVQISPFSTWETDPVGNCQIEISTALGAVALPTLGIYVRFQHDPGGLLGAPKTDYC